MSKIGNAIQQLYHIDTLATRDQWVNKLHPLVKFVITICYIAVVVSFQKYDVIGLAGMVIYPLALFILSELSFWDSVKRLWLVLPLICFVGILNPFFDKNYIILADMRVSAGVLSMITLIVKGVFTVLASYLLIATTSMDKLCYALCLLRIPKPIITQFMLTYRYITLLLGEVERITQAYSLRAPKQKGVHFKVWGSLTGQLLLRSMDRANAVYESMLLRGYRGDYQYLHGQIALQKADVLYGLFWLGIFALFRACPVILIAGYWMGGMFR